MNAKKLYGIMFTFFVAVMPIILWLVFSPTKLDLTDPSQKFEALSKAVALSGLALLSFNIILSARLQIFERLFLGLDRAYRAHRIIGGTVLILLMLHAALITAKYSSISLASGFEFLKPNLDLALMLGKIALAIMIILVSVSIYVKIKYQWFITIQRTLGALIFIGGYHALFVSGSDIRTNAPLFLYFILVGGSAAGLYIYRSLFHKSILRKLEYTVHSVTNKSNISIIWLKPRAKALAFYAGQFAFFKFSSDAVDEESHPFTISSGSDNDNIRIAAKASGDYTSKLHGLSAGDSVQVEGPYGQFSFTKIRSTKQVWVAGGIGITPFLSMASSLPANFQITLYYCVQSLPQAVFLDELNNVVLSKPGLKIVTVCSDQNQRITAKDIAVESADDYLLCAPTTMMHDLETQLVSIGISKNNIHYEDFKLV